ncbi:MAG: DNA mismatch repair endonuclease MutL, partial [Leptospiraceae bacterium]|nr:DNA mismatch repair endonuclease MutL [Leptospiraceae bacterium]
MATHIKKLPAVLIDRIAAGEVVDGPHSVIKELVENALDAGADRIRVSTVAAGLDSILIEDNGRGIPYADLPLSIERHATSKITDLSDLEQITSFGFRGEALASIASVAHVEIQSRSEDAELGGRLECRGGELIQIEPQACNPGTVIRVNELFYATPARRKYVKSERSENIRNMRTLTAIALAHPSVHMTYIRDGREYFDLLPADTLAERVKSIFPERIQHHLVEVDYTASGMSLTGVVADGDYYRANREGQYLFVNNRPVEVKHFSYLVKKSYGELLPPGSHPYYFLFLEIPPDRVDVNVHPAKREVRLLDESSLHGLVTGALETALRPRHPLQYSHEREQSRMAGHRMTHRYIQTVDQVLFERPPAVRESYSIPADAHSGAHDRDATERHIDSSNLGSDYRPGERQTVDGIMHGDEPSGDDYFDGRHEPSPNDGNSSAPARSFLPRKHFGTFYGAYIIAEGDDGLYIIDQHTAHERINYEKKRRQLEQVRGERQP